MTKIERVVGLAILVGFICTLDIVFFDHVYSRAGETIEELAKALAP